MGFLTWKALFKCQTFWYVRNDMILADAKSDVFMIVWGIGTSDLSRRFILALKGSPVSFSPLFNNLWNNSKWNITLGSIFSNSNFQSRNSLFADVNLFKVSRLICTSSLWILTCGMSYVRPIGCLGNAVFLKTELKSPYEYGCMPSLALEVTF